MRKKSKKKKIPKRIVLGIGHPWYSISSNRNGYGFDAINLTQKPVNESILFRGDEKTVPFKYGKTGNWNKVRLVLEVLK